MDTKDLLYKILETIEYQDDKEAFVIEFIQLLYDQTTLEILNLLSQEDKKKLEVDLLNSDIESAHTVFTRYISKESYLKHLQDVSNRLFADYFETLAPTITDEQEEKLTELLKTLKPQNT
jgi:hypothetical protein